MPYLQPSHSLYEHLVVEGGHRTETQFDDLINRKIKQHLSGKFFTAIRDSGAKSDTKISFFGCARISQRFDQALERLTEGARYSATVERLTSIENALWESFIDAVAEVKRIESGLA